MGALFALLVCAGSSVAGPPVPVYPARLPTKAVMIDSRGVAMKTNIFEFTQGETGPMTALLQGDDGLPEDLSTARRVRFDLRAKTGDVVVSRGATTNLSNLGRVTYNRVPADVAKAGEFLGQFEVVRADGTMGYLPTGGIAITILPAVVAPDEP